VFGVVQTQVHEARRVEIVPHGMRIHLNALTDNERLPPLEHCEGKVRVDLDTVFVSFPLS
jgi:hypothetical protein